jgi:hypothetical protein
MKQVSAEFQRNNGEALASLGTDLTIDWLCYFICSAGAQRIFFRLLLCQHDEQRPPSKNDGAGYIILCTKTIYDRGIY